MTKSQKNKLILILGFIAALGPFSIDMYLPSFLNIAEDLNTEIEKVSYTLTSYFIGITLGQLVYGPIIDRYGRKKPMIIGFTIFVISSIGCALAPDIYTLIVLRFFLALGGCVGMVASRAIVRDRFENNEIAKAFSSLILVMGVAPIVAPTIGGYVSANWGWQSIFILLAVIGLILIAVIYFFLSESKEPDPDVSFNLKQVTISYWQVLKNRDFLMYGLAGSMAMAGMFAYIAGSPFVIMDYFGVSEKMYGWIFGLNAAAFILGSQLNRVLLLKLSSEVISYVTALILGLIGITALVVVYSNGLNYTSVLILLSSFMLVSGILNPNTTAMALTPFTKNAGVASALIGALRMLSGVFASMAIALFHNETHLPMVLFIIGCSLAICLLLFTQRVLNKREAKKGLEIS